MAWEQGYHELLILSSQACSLCEYLYVALLGMFCMTHVVENVMSSIAT